MCCVFQNRAIALVSWPIVLLKMILILLSKTLNHFGNTHTHLIYSQRLQNDVHFLFPTIRLLYTTLSRHDVHGCWIMGLTWIHLWVGKSKSVKLWWQISRNPSLCLFYRNPWSCVYILHTQPHGVCCCDLIRFFKFRKKCVFFLCDSEDVKCPYFLSSSLLPSPRLAPAEE